MPLHPLQVVTHAVVGLRPDPGPARQWVERELSRSEYQQGLLERFFGWLRDLVSGLRVTALDATPFSATAAVVVTVVLVVLVGLVVSRVRREPSGGGQHSAVLVSGDLSAEEHRRLAEEALARGAHDRAIVEAFRGLAVRAVRRGVVEERPGLTAHELAVDLGPVFPAQSTALREASILFDLVFYGDQPASAADARSVLDLEEALRVGRPTRAADTVAEAISAVPR